LTQLVEIPRTWSITEKVLGAIRIESMIYTGIIQMYTSPYAIE